MKPVVRRKLLSTNYEDSWIKLRNGLTMLTIHPNLNITTDGVIDELANKKRILEFII
jgi:hypothetical protein